MQMTGPCEHCYNPDKSKWLSDCKYKGGFPSRRAFELSTVDPPCAHDAYAEGQREFARDGNRKLLLLVSIIILLACLFFGYARAHDNPTDWIGQERRMNAGKQLCCGEGDCHSFAVDQVKVMPDGYHFPDGEVVPFNKVAPSIDHFYWKCVWANETKCVFAPL